MEKCDTALPDSIYVVNSGDNIKIICGNAFPCFSYFKMEILITLQVTLFGQQSRSVLQGVVLLR